MKKIYNKLIRDKIPSIIEDNDEKPKIRILSDSEFGKELYRKMVEEVSEFIKDRNMEELADVLEVIDSIVMLNGWNKKEIEEIRKEKFKGKGGFEKRFFLESVEYK